MKRLLILLVTIGLLAGASYLAYQHYLPAIVANNITSQTDHSWIPFDADSRITKIKKPVNEIATEVVRQVHASNLTIEDIIRAIDNAREEQAYAMLDEMNEKEIDDPDSVFTLAKKYFPVDFNVEVLRKPFTEKITAAHIRKGLRLANQYKDQQELDAETAKSILKRVILQKEEDFNKALRKK